jgi:hemoglobin-like flavoprotein
MDKNIIDKVKQSYGRALSSPHFWDSFYKNFLESSDQVALMFKNTDFTKQKELIKSSITFVLMYAQDENASFAKNKLEEVGHIHSRKAINVDPTMYPLWVNSLIKTLSEHDDHWNHDLEMAWRKAVSPAILLLSRLY